ncbi:MAG: hypothetical protein ACYS8X_10330 [Planctomycetota bacterium]|jgi:hypothetical protein
MILRWLGMLATIPSVALFSFRAQLVFLFAALTLALAQYFVRRRVRTIEDRAMQSLRAHRRQLRRKGRIDADREQIMAITDRTRAKSAVPPRLVKASRYIGLAGFGLLALAMVLQLWS